VQIVQQKIGHKSTIGVQQIQQLIKQQQQQSQHAQIIATPAGMTPSSATGQTIIATTQLITPSNMHGESHTALLCELIVTTWSSYCNYS